MYSLENSTNIVGISQIYSQYSNEIDARQKKEKESLEIQHHQE